MNLGERAQQARTNLGLGVVGRLAQAAAATGIAWELALQLPNHGRPFFAPISAAIALGAERGTRGRQAIRMMTGVSVGILVGAAVLAVAGAGAWQIVLGTALALVLTTAAGAPLMVRNQAAASAILIVALHRPGSNLAVQRLEDALIGGAVAILIARFLLPIDPIPLVREAARNLREQLAAALDEAADALADHDRKRAEAAVERMWSIDDSALAQALLIAREVTRAAPRRRPLRRRVEKLGEMYRELEASVYDSHAIATGVVRLADSDRPPPREATATIEAAARAVRAIEPEAARAAAEATRAAARGLREGDTSLGAAVMAHGAVGVAEHTLRAARAREEERRLGERRPLRRRFRRRPNRAAAFGRLGSHDLGGSECRARRKAAQSRLARGSQRLRTRSGFAPIGSYAAIGDGRTVALVAADGSVDFMSLPSLHAPTTFAALLDPERGGRFTLAPAGGFEAARRYVGRTNVLETTYRTGDGVVRVTEALTLQDGGLLPWVELARRIEGVEGSVRLEWRLEPRFDWGRDTPRIVRRGDRLVAEGGRLQLAIHSWDAGDVEPEEDALAGSFEITAGRSALLALVAAFDQPLHAPSRDHVEARLDATRRVWERWLGMWAYDGPWVEEVARSALALKLLVYAPSGSIAAAPTTSLPEVIGGGKNYDYRYSWVRDSAFTLDALMRLGLPEQVQESFGCLLRAVRGTAPDLRPFYDLDGCVPDRSEELSHLSGYRDSRPVRYGNAARTQLQLGSWGDLLETAALYVSEGNALDEATGEMLAGCVDRVALLWEDEDSGMWELDEHRHYTASKIAVWMALDRALSLADNGHVSDGHATQWREQRERIHTWIEESCWSDELGAYCGWAGEASLDAGVLRAVRMSYPERERLGRTVDTIRERLAAGPGLLYRTSEHVGEEGAFVACSFWLVEALARLGRVDEACETMEQILPYANDLGLFSEEIDPESGELLGNFPQGLSHLALINAAGAIQDAAGRGAGASAKAGAVRG